MRLPGAVLDPLPFLCSLGRLIVSLLGLYLPVTSFLLLRVFSLHILVFLLLLRMLLVVVLLLLSMFLRSIIPLYLLGMSSLLALLLMLRFLSMLRARLAFLVSGLFVLDLLLGTIPLVAVLIPLCVGCSRGSESQGQNCCTYKSGNFQGVPPLLRVANICSSANFLSWC